MWLRMNTEGSCEDTHNILDYELCDQWHHFRQECGQGIWEVCLMHTHMTWTPTSEILHRQFPKCLMHHDKHVPSTESCVSQSTGNALCRHKETFQDIWALHYMHNHMICRMQYLFWAFQQHPTVASYKQQCQRCLNPPEIACCQVTRVSVNERSKLQSFCFRPSDH